MLSLPSIPLVTRCARSFQQIPYRLMLFLASKVLQPVQLVSPNIQQLGILCSAAPFALLFAAGYVPYRV